MTSISDLRAKRARLELRGRILSATRSFFQSRGCLEVVTPVRVATPALEDHIDAEPSGDHWLRTSPELHMKRMLCAGYGDIYQIGPCFRRGERGDVHLPEYTMLEWYRTGVTSDFLIEETRDLLASLAEAAGGTVFNGVDLAAPSRVLKVSDIFLDAADWDPVADFDADRFDLDLVENVEPRLAEIASPVVLRDFPAARSALARLRPDDPRVADRWELYLGGVEIANAYTELTDPDEQRRRFEACAVGRSERDQDIYPPDESFLGALEEGMPECAGIALGLDRLVMCLSATSRIQDVVAFPP